MQNIIPHRWARQHDACITCHGTDRPHFARGKCQPCYFAEYNPAHSATIKRYKRKWYRQAGGRTWSRTQREQRNYGGLRESVLRRDGYRCTNCGSPHKLLVHHRDRNGRGKPRPNNTMDNLTTLCRACHINQHRPELEAARRANGWRRPSGLTYRKRG